MIRTLLTRRNLTYVLLWMAISSAAYADPRKAPVPQDVSEFIARRDKCDHFRGEEADSEARTTFLAAKTREFCLDSDKNLRTLKKKYKNDKKIQHKLSKYDDNIE